MLTSAADYTYNSGNIAARNVTIQGRIIPTEDIDGLPHPLRRENFAYLSEAISERHQSAIWRVPDYRAPVVKYHPASLASSIEDLFANNSQFLIEDPTVYPARASSTLFSASDTYLDKLLDSSDCDIPANVPDELGADYLRHLFYAVNRLRFGWQSFAPTTGTFGGSVTFDAKSRDGTGSFSQQCDNNTMQPFGSSSGNNIAVPWQIGSTSGTFRLGTYGLFAFVDLDYSLPSVYDPAYEGAYSGWLYFGLSAMPAFTSPRLFLRFTVTSIQGTKYVWKPVQARIATNADGFAYLFGVAVDRGFFRDIVTLCFPGTSFTLSGTSTRSYSVSLGDAAVLAEFPYKSILPSAWTWTPT